MGWSLEKLVKEVEKPFPSKGSQVTSSISVVHLSEGTMLPNQSPVFRQSEVWRSRKEV